jgi:two-component system, NarL family, sensor kinase
MAAGLVAVLIVGFATAIASRRIGEREAIVDARTTALVRAQGVVEPAVTDGLLTRQPAAVAKVASVVESAVIDESLVRVKIWTRAGVVVYSDEPRLDGLKYQLGADEIAAIDLGRIEAEVSDLAKPENRFERPQKKLLEVYLPIRTPNGQRLLFEAYFRYGAVSAAGARIWRSFAPISLGALIVLELIQVPFAWSLARRLRQRQREREALLSQALDASDRERRRIAADLHDGVVQDLAGVAYALTGAARQPNVPAETAQELERSATGVRSGVKALRSLLIEIYPPNLAEIGLGSALTDLVARAELRDVTATLDVAELNEPLPGPIAALLYRCAQEALRNVFAHSRARSVVVRAATDQTRAVLDVRDDGVGFDAATVGSHVATGHFGLQGVEDLVAAAGGSSAVRSSPGNGTELHVEVPLR